jgi:hypothetical protein
MEILKLQALCEVNFKSDVEDQYDLPQESLTGRYCERCTAERGIVWYEPQRWS